MEREYYIRRVGNALSEQDLNFTNRILHSHTTRFEKHEKDSGLSIKLSINGPEDYFIGPSRFKITSGRYLLVNRHQEFTCSIKQAIPTEGMCFYLDSEVVNGIHNAYLQSPEGLVDNDLQNKPFELMEKIYSLQENELGHYIQSMLPVLRDPIKSLELDYPAVFQDLSEHLVRSQLAIRKQLMRISNAKRSTREEIFRRVSRVRNFIDENFLDELCLEELASLACLSKFHFLRCFKEVYDISPYQYVIQKRLGHGKKLLNKQNTSLSEIAYQIGFTDRRAFNKAFRKAFGMSPSEFRAG